MHSVNQPLYILQLFQQHLLPTRQVLIMYSWTNRQIAFVSADNEIIHLTFYRRTLSRLYHLQTKQAAAIIATTTTKGQRKTIMMAATMIKMAITIISRMPRGLAVMIILLTNLKMVNISYEYYDYIIALWLTDLWQQDLTISDRSKKVIPQCLSLLFLQKPIIFGIFLLTLSVNFFPMSSYSLVRLFNDCI